MGRRAKNKQGDPTPLAEANGVSAKKLGKRKAEYDGEAEGTKGALSSRPTKKVKEAVKGKSKTPAKTKVEKKVEGKKVKGKIAET